MSDLTGKVIWFCGLTSRALSVDGSAGKIYCRTPTAWLEVRHLKSRYGCGWYELTAIKEDNDG